MLPNLRIRAQRHGRLISSVRVVVLLACPLLVGCSEVEQPTDAELKQKLLGRWQFETESARGDLEFEKYDRMRMRAKGKAVLQRFAGEIKHKWKIENGCLSVYVNDSGNDLAQVLFWPGSAQKTPIKIEQLDDQQLVLKDVGTLERIEAR